MRIGRSSFRGVQLYLIYISASAVILERREGNRLGRDLTSSRLLPSASLLGLLALSTMTGTDNWTIPVWRSTRNAVAHDLRDGLPICGSALNRNLPTWPQKKATLRDLFFQKKKARRPRVINQSNLLEDSLLTSKGLIAIVRHFTTTSRHLQTQEITKRKYTLIQFGATIATWFHRIVTTCLLALLSCRINLTLSRFCQLRAIGWRITWRVKPRVSQPTFYLTNSTTPGPDFC